MRRVPTAGVPQFLVLVVAVIALGGCANDPVTGERHPNRAPEVWLSSAPPEGTESRYRIRLFWGGWDPDGEISHYEYYITDNENGTLNPDDTLGVEWMPVYANDSLYTFTADQLADSSTTELVTEFRRSHTFFLRAVDDEGMRSERAAYRSFTAWTLSPSVRVTIPVTKGYTVAQVRPITTYRWNATDYVNTKLEVQPPDSVRHILVRAPNGTFEEALEYIQRNPDAKEWSKWEYYDPVDPDSGNSWTTPPTNFGQYMFAVQAKDEAGAVTPIFDQDLNARRVRVSATDTGPIFTVSNEFLGSVVTSTITTPTRILDLPSGVPVMFRLSARADHYGGVVSGYRYGWDISDLSNPDQWETDWTPFTSTVARLPSRTFYFGTHTFVAEVIDNSGARSRIQIKVNMVPFTMDRDVLFVDDYFENPLASGWGNTNGAVPSDEEHDQFWVDMLSGVEGFNPQTDVLSLRQGLNLPITTLAQYKSLVWSVYGGYNVTGSAVPFVVDLIRFRSKDPSSTTAAGKVLPNLLALFMRAGGHLFFSGNQPLSLVINSEFFGAAPKFPFLLKYELEGDQRGQYTSQFANDNFVGDESFAYKDACLSTLDIAFTGYGSLRREHLHGCGVFQTRGVSGITEGLREALPLDPSFPKLTLKSYVGGDNAFYGPGRPGIQTEIYNPPFFEFCDFTEHNRECFEPIYGNGCADEASVIYNNPVAFWSKSYENVVPDVENGVGARSVFWGFPPVFFKDEEVREAVEHVLFDEWQLPRAP